MAGLDSPMVIRIVNKIQSLIPFTTPGSSIKFHRNLFITS